MAGMTHLARHGLFERAIELSVEVAGIHAIAFSVALFARLHIENANALNFVTGFLGLVAGLLFLRLLMPIRFYSELILCMVGLGLACFAWLYFRYVWREKWFQFE